MTSEEWSQEAILLRLQRMGISAQLLPGGRCVLARMRLQRRIFETSTTPLIIDEVTFATVANDRAKCVKPRALFQLPILEIQDCRDATEIEARIHLAWQRHSLELARTYAWLRGIGANCSSEDQAVVQFPFGSDDPKALARMIDSRRVILPSRGLLSGVPLQRVDDRLMDVVPQIAHARDLERSIASRLEQLAHLDSRLAEGRQRASSAPPAAEVAPRTARRAVVLMVGPWIGHERQCAEALRLRGFRPETVLTERDAIAAFDRCSPELVLADVELGDSIGVGLIQSLRRVPGIEEVPVVLVDRDDRAANRELARRSGAAGYLVQPLDLAQLAEHLDRIASEPRRRRFTRYDTRLAVSIRGRPDACVTASIGRGGMFLATDDEIPKHTVAECSLALPGLGRRLRVESEVLYRARKIDTASSALGVRFHAFPDSDEPLLIQYLKNLHGSAPIPT